jgi:hypothetical protein
MTINVLMTKRPLPTLSQWLDAQNGGERAEDFDGLTALTDLAERTILQPSSGLPPEQACFLRLWQGMLVATVELCNIEHNKAMSTETIVAMLPRALACAAVYAMASIVRDDAPMRDIAKVLTEEFRFAAKQSADDLMEKQ